MHIPDGFLSGKVLALTACGAAGGLAAAVWDTSRLPRRRIPLLGLSAAFVFAAQMLNFPVASGTSGHLLGGVLVAALLGPSAAVLVVTSVLVVQCLVFADGGALALGANVLNMAIVDSVAGYYIYRMIRWCRPTARGRIVAISIGAWAGAVLAAMVCSGELALSGTLPARLVFRAMVGVHTLIGAGEAVITALVIAAVAQARPELLEPGALTGVDQPRAGIGRFILFGLLISAALALFVSPFACPWPDGLDHVAEKLGIASLASDHKPVLTPLAGYKFPAIRSARWATALAGLAGTLIVFTLSLLVTRLLVALRVKSGVGPPAGDDVPVTT